MIWLVGNHGMLGTEVEALLRGRGHPLVATDTEVDITSAEAPAAFLASRGFTRIEWIVNCAAYTAVDKAEDQPELAHAVNATGVANLCAAARALGAALLQVSTDYVFDGTKNDEYVEDDTPHPLGVYGHSKLMGERAVCAALDRYVILRTAWLYGRGGKNFVATMLRLFRERGGADVVDDQWGNPTSAADLAHAILAVVERGCPPSGIFHVTGRGATSWFGFAQEIRAQALARGMIDASVTVRPIKTSQRPTRAKRPSDSRLSCAKFRATYGVETRAWQAALGDWFDTEGA